MITWLTLRAQPKRDRFEMIVVLAEEEETSVLEVPVLAQLLGVAVVAQEEGMMIVIQKDVLLVVADLVAAVAVLAEVAKKILKKGLHLRAVVRNLEAVLTKKAMIQETHLLRVVVDHTFSTNN